MSYERWSNEEDDVIELGIKEGMTYKQISQNLPHRTPGAVSSRAHYMRQAYSRQTNRKVSAQEIKLLTILCWISTVFSFSTCILVLAALMA